MSEDRITRFVHKVPGTANARFYETKVREDGDYYFIDTAFCLKDEVKRMQGAKWMGGDDTPEYMREKRWRVNKCRRNDFALSYLEGKNPYAKYKTPLVDKKENGFLLRHTREDVYKNVWPIYEHQKEGILHILLRRQCIVAGEMGVGKSLMLFEAAELSLIPSIWYVGPKSAIASVKLDAWKWKFKTAVRYMTYDELKGVLKNWRPGDPPPTFVCFDESSRIKNATSQRSQACLYLAEAMRDAYGDKAYIIEMSGSPAPKSPLDWYHQCEVACPGYLAEGDVKKFQRRYAVTAKREDVTSYAFSQIVCWRDGNANRCDMCGGTREDHESGSLFGQSINHEFVPLKNEVNELYKRMGGLVWVKFKKDCLDLPEKQYRVVKIKPSMDLLRAARIVQSQSRTAIEQMTLLRELSDGFQYRDNMIAREECETCKGKRTLFKEDGSGEEACFMCSGTGEQIKEEREVIEVESPKLEKLRDLLEENEETTGRLVVYAGFKASIDRICKYVKSQGWEFIRVDGRGWSNSINHGMSSEDCLKLFQDPNNETKIVFVGHPGSAGMGLTLTASSMIVYFSNDFNAESRIQSEDRIHRAGMDVNRGAIIVDLILLPTDMKVLENLRAKRKLQAITMNELASAMESYKWEEPDALISV